MRLKRKSRKKLEERKNCINFAKKKEDMEQVIDKLREIASKSYKQVTDDDKVFIRDLAPRYGIELPKDKPNCKSCYVDAAVMIYKSIKDAEKVEQEKSQRAAEESKPDALRLKSGVDVMWRGIRINEASSTPSKLKEWVSNGFPIRFCDGY